MALVNLNCSLDLHIFYCKFNIKYLKTKHLQCALRGLSLTVYWFCNVRCVCRQMREEIRRYSKSLSPAGFQTMQFLVQT